MTKTEQNAPLGSGHSQASGTGRAEACANIALAKYWGKSPRGGNLTAVPSLSLTLDALRTRTEVQLTPGLSADEITLNGSAVEGRGRQRIVALLDRMRDLAAVRTKARVDSTNDFPTAAGLASSASGFAALALASARAFGLPLTHTQLSSQARQGSASAARSLFGGFVELEKEADVAAAIATPDHWDVAMVVAVIGAGQKEVSSTGGMVQTAKTCPYYSAWLEKAPELFRDVKGGVLTHDFTRVAEAMEESTRLMHATMMTSVPPILYLRGPTIELMHEISRRRAGGDPVAYTMDAGPNVKVLTLASHVTKVVEFLRATEGVSDVIVCRPGPRAAVLSNGGTLSEAARQEET